MSEHTPAPWRAEHTNKTIPSWTVYGTDGEPVASTLAYFGRHSHEANARLIAACPDLLEACKGLMKCAVDEVNAGQLGLKAEWLAARAAIAKATGKQPSPESPTTEIVRPKQS